MFASRARSYGLSTGCGRRSTGGPQAGALALLARALHLLGEQALAHRGRRVDIRVAAHRLVQQRRGGGIGVGEEQRVAQLGDGLGLQHEVDEGPRRLGVRRIGGNRHGVEPDQRALARDAVDHFERLPGLGGTCGGHAGVAGVGQRQAQAAVGQIVDMPGAADIAQVRLQAGKQCPSRLEILGRIAVGILAQVVEGNGDHLLRRVEHGDAAILELAGVFGPEQQIEAVQGHAG